MFPSRLKNSGAVLPYAVIRKVGYLCHSQGWAREAEVYILGIIFQVHYVSKKRLRRRFEAGNQE
jgi:hypothetical protein